MLGRVRDLKSRNHLGADVNRMRFARFACSCVRVALGLWLVLLCAPTALPGAEGTQRPKIRAITAFVRLDRARYKEEIADALKMLRQGKTDFEKAGYEVESIRITTQPFTDYTRGLSHKDALEFLRQYDALAQRDSFATSIGPALVKATPPPPAR